MQIIQDSNNNTVFRNVKDGSNYQEIAFGTTLQPIYAEAKDGVWSGHKHLYGEHNKELLSGEEYPLPLVANSEAQDKMVRYFKTADGTVVLNFNVQEYEGTIPTNNYFDIATMPVGYRPSFYTFASAAVGNSGVAYSGTASINVDPDGKVRIVTTLENPKFIRATIVYKAAN